MIPHEPSTPLPDDLSLTESELGQWISKVRELPVVRVDRIVATRDRLRRQTYDCPKILEHTIDRVANDVVALCRLEDSDGHGD